MAAKQRPLAPDIDTPIDDLPTAAAERLELERAQA